MREKINEPVKNHVGSYTAIKGINYYLKGEFVPLKLALCLPVILPQLFIC